MWVTVARLISRHGQTALFPAVALFGFLGYTIEGWISDRYTPPTAPVVQQREERLLENLDAQESKKKHDPLSVNLSPSLAS